MRRQTPSSARKNPATRKRRQEARRRGAHRSNAVVDTMEWGAYDTEGSSSLGRWFFAILAAHVVVVVGLLAYEFIKGADWPSLSLVEHRAAAQEELVSGGTTMDPLPEAPASLDSPAPTPATAEDRGLPALDAAVPEGVAEPVAEPVPAPVFSDPAPAAAPAADSPPIRAIPVVDPAVEQARARSIRIATYTVLEGDTLFGIAQRFGIKPEAIMRLNQLADARDLRAGNEIRIPVPATPGA